MCFTNLIHIVICHLMSIRINAMLTICLFAAEDEEANRLLNYYLL